MRSHRDGSVVVFTVTVTVTVAVTVALTAVAVHANPSSPNYNEQGDAGSLPLEAQPLVGVGPIQVISGFTGPGDFEDMYVIHIFDPDAFTASTSPAVLGGNASFDTQIWLFDAFGIGVAANDECPIGGGPGSCLTNIGPGGAGLLIQPGFYYLAISGFDNDPGNIGGFIFNQNPRDDVTGPDGTGGAGPIEGWNPPGDTGGYQIRLLGAEYIIPPSPFEPGTKHTPMACPCAGECEECPDDDEGMAIDPVYLFNGEFYTSAVDLRVKGRGFDFIWGRKYRSQLGPDSEMGNRWDFSYNISLEPCAQHLILHDGNSRSDLYQLQPDGTWARSEFFNVIEQNPDTSFTMTLPDTGTWNFNPLNGSPEAGKISSIIDRNGNALTFDYDGATGRLTTIHDTLDTVGNPREYTIAYNADGFISSLTDFTGRQVTYEYYDINDVGGSFGDLKSVTTPAVVGTPNGNDFPGGKTTTYTYTTGFVDDRLNHDLLTITDPKGQTYLTNVYAHTVGMGDPRFTTSDADLHFDRVVRQTWGDPNDIIDVFYVEQVPDFANSFSVIKAIVNDREGHVKEYFYDGLNRGVISREFTGIAPDPDALTDDVTNRPTGQLRLTDPGHFETRWEFNADSLATLIIYPNLNQEVHVYDSANPDRRSQGNLLQKQRLPGPLGGDQTDIVELFEYDDGFGGCCGTNFVTRHTDGRGNDTVHEYDPAGNRTRTIHRIPSIVEDFEYNAFGQMTARVHADNGSGHRRRDEFTYYGSGPQNGYLGSKTEDPNTLALTTTYEYDSVGNMTRTIDPRGNDSQYAYNALDQVVRELSRETSTGSGVRYEKLTFYDANDNVVRIDIENRDETGALQPNTHFTTIYEYEILNNVTRKCQETGSVNLAPGDLTCGLMPQSDSIVEEYEYDDNRNRTVVRLGEATDGDQPNNFVRSLYDERDLVFQVIRAQGDAAQSTSQFDYDGNQNRLTIRGGLEDAPRMTTYVYDGYDRLTRSIDPMGNESTFHYDANSNRNTARADGELMDVLGGGSNVRLLETEYEYDNMDRLTRTTSEHFDSATQTGIGDGQSIIIVTFSDNSQVTTSTDDNGRTTTYAYDTANRLTLVTDAKGNTDGYVYDPNSNIITRTETDKSDLLNPDQIFVTTYEYDSLNRLTRTVDNVGNDAASGYDSRGNETRSDDALGNTTRFDYDGLNRITRTIRDLDGDGADGDGSDIVTIKIWDDTSRVTGETDDLGNTTTYEYDSLNRMTRTIHADGTDGTSTYDVHDNRTGSADANGSSATYDYDLLNRLTLTTVTPGAGVSSDTTFEIYQYDGRSRPVRIEDDDSVVTRAYDSHSNVTTETLNGQSTASTHDGVDNQTSCTYPGGRELIYVYDALDRIGTISDGGQLIATFAYVGPRRVERREYGNGTRTDFAYDGISGVPNPPGDSGVRRLIGTSHSVIIGGAIIDERTYTWDAMYNKTQRKDVRAGGPQLTHDYEYDSIYRMTRSIASDVVPTTLRDTTYLYDGAGNRLTLQGDNFGTYVLDPTTPQPADAQVNQYTKTPQDQRIYDENGNLVQVRSALRPDLDLDDDVDAGDFALFGQCFGGSFQPPAPGCPPGVNADFDGDGDVDLGDFALLSQCFGGAFQPPAPSCVFGGVSATFSYDYRNRLVEFIDVDAGQRHTYAYDALDRRIGRVLDADGAATETRYYYDGWQVCEEQDGAGATQATYVYGNYVDEVLNMQRGGGEFYYHTDDLYNVTAVTDAAGTAVERYEYDDFGRLTISDGAGAPLAATAIGNRYAFTGRRHDSESGWYYYRSRYLDPVAGRFITRDPIGEWGDTANIGNAYTYVSNNPFTFVDPTGEKTATASGRLYETNRAQSFWEGDDSRSRHMSEAERAASRYLKHKNYAEWRLSIEYNCVRGVPSPIPLGSKFEYRLPGAFYGHGSWTAGSMIQSGASYSFDVKAITLSLDLGMWNQLAAQFYSMTEKDCPRGQTGTIIDYLYKVRWLRTDYIRASFSAGPITAGEFGTVRKRTKSEGWASFTLECCCPQ